MELTLFLKKDGKARLDARRGLMQDLLLGYGTWSAKGPELKVKIPRSKIGCQITIVATRQGDSLSGTYRTFNGETCATPIERTLKAKKHE